MNLTAISIKRPSIIIVIFTILMIGGAVCYTTLNYELLPPMEVPTLVITTSYPGAAPSEVEQSVTKKVEDVVSGLDGVKSVLAQSYESTSVVIVEFAIGTDTDVKQQDAQRQINNILNTLPDEVASPSISKVSPSDRPIMELMVISKMSARESYDLVENEILPQLKQIAGVGETRLLGGQKREIKVNVDKDKLSFYGLSLSQVTNAINNANMDFPTGKVKDRSDQITVRLAGKFASIGQIEALTIASHQGSPIRVVDVAEVFDGIQDQSSISRFNGEEGIGISIKKQSNANAVAISEQVREKIVSIKERYASQGVQIIIADDTSEFTLEAADAVTHDLVIAVFLVAIVMLLFLHSLRDSLIVLIAIPASLLSTFIAMYLFGYSLNLMTLLAMSLVIGILVDDSIVVLENIHRHLQMGKDRITATLDGRKEIGFSAMAITMVDIVVFTPIAMINTVIGDVLRQYAVTIVVSTLMSLFVCYTITPWLASRFGKVTHLTSKNWMHRPLIEFESWVGKLTAWYANQLRWILGHKLIMSIATVAAFVVTGVIMNLGILGQEMVASGDRGKVLFKLEYDKRMSLTENNIRSLRIEKFLMSQPEVKTVFSNVGGTSSSSVIGALGSENKTEMIVGLTETDKRSVTTAEFMIRVRNELESNLPGLKVNSTVIGITASDEPIQLVLSSENTDDLTKATHQLASLIKRLPGANDVSVSVEGGSPELMISLDREKLSQLGLTVGEVGAVLKNAYSGNTDAKYRVGNNEYEINVKLDEFDRSNPLHVEDVTFVNKQGGLVALSQFASLSQNSGPSMLERKDRRTSVTIKSNVLGITSGTLAKKITASLYQDPLPASVDMKWTGDIDRQVDSFEALGLALGGAILLVYLVMVVLYDSFIYPFVVLFSVPVALIGALIALNIAMSSLSIFTMLGIIMLIGLVLKNGILIVDFANQRKLDGLSTFDALMDAGQSRLRPILMTTIAMVIGMFPIALAEGAGSEWKNGLAIVMIGGLLSSLVLTVFVVPMVYYIVDRIQEKVAGTCIKKIVPPATPLEVGYMTPGGKTIL